MKKTIIAQVSEMTVAQMRKSATQYGIKNASKYKRAELETMLVDAMVAEAEANAKKDKAASKKSYKAETIKRYKAEKVVEDDIETQAAEIIANNIVTGLFDINRKVLIVVMKKLGCEKWYRTYDKPTMIDKITGTLAAA